MSSSSSALAGDIRKTGGGAPSVPEGGMKLFDPSEEGKLGGTSDLMDRLSKGADFTAPAAAAPAAAEAPVAAAAAPSGGEMPAPGFDTISLHGGYKPDTDVSYGMGYGAPRGVPLYRTTPYVFRNSEHAANLFALKELGNIYSRLMNPTNHVLEARYSLLEGGHEMAGLSVASGTNAIFYAIATLAQAGDNIVSSSQLYGGTYTYVPCHRSFLVSFVDLLFSHLVTLQTKQVLVRGFYLFLTLSILFLLVWKPISMFDELLPKFGIEVRFVDGTDPANFAKVVDDKTRAFFTEGCSNPSLDVFDIEKIANEAHAIGLPLIVDSTFSTPYLCKPLEYGADIIATSATKWVGGHGTGIAGIIVDGGKFNWGAGKHPLFDQPDNSYGGLRWGHDLPDSLQPLAFKLRALTCNLRNLGGCLSPDNAWIMLQGIETLSLRMDRHCENSLKVAQYLQKHPKVAWVRYPGLPDDRAYELNKKYLKGKGGGIVVFGIKSDNAKEAGQKFIDSMQLFSHVANVGDARSLCIHPASTTHSQLSEEQLRAAGVAPDLVRLSVGIESIEDIIADLEQGLAKATA